MSGIQIALAVFFLFIFLVLFTNILENTSEKARWLLWKKKAKRAIQENRIAKCYACNNHIFPNQCVAIGIEEGQHKDVLIHAGFHFSLKKISDFCETGALASGWWDGEKVVPYRQTMTDLLMSGECGAVIDNGDDKLVVN